MDEEAFVSGEGAYILDTGVFIACGRPSNTKYGGLAAFAEEAGITFVIPERVHEELGGSPAGYSVSNAPVDRAIEAGWVEVFAELDYTSGAVSQAMDDVRECVARESNRAPDRVEKADTALAGVALQLLDRDEAERVFVVTTDAPAGRGVVRALGTQGYGEQVEFVEGFGFVEESSGPEYREV
jgi:hypothetical protein